MYLFISSNKGISVLELTSQLDIIYNSMFKLCIKYHLLMTLSNMDHIQNSLFYKTDTSYIDEKHFINLDYQLIKSPFFVMLSTDRKNNYTKYSKLAIIPSDKKHYMSKFFKMNMVVFMDSILNIFNKTIVRELAEYIQLKLKKINYNESNQFIQIKIILNFFSRNF